MVDWLAGKRMKGTSSERTSLSTTALGGTGVGGWVELARTTLGSNSNPITVSSIPDKRYYMVLFHTTHSSGSWNQPRFRMGNGSVDTGGNYTHRESRDGAADSSLNQNTYVGMWANLSSPNTPLFGVGYIANRSANEKLTLGHSVDRNTAGAANVPSRSEWTGKWINTSNPLDLLELNEASLNNFSTGDEMVVLGYDPSDTHTTNFWQELASVSGGSATMDATITSKKYIWFQAFVDGNGSGTGYRPYLRVGNSSIDTGNNYAQRISDNGGADATYASQNSLPLASSGDTTPKFVNGFIINNASNEKLMIVHSVSQSTAGAGTAPIRSEYAYKWANTSNQIDKLQIFAGLGSDTATTAASVFKVWGAD